MLAFSETSGPRFDLAIERLRAGHTVAFQDMTLFIGPDGHLELSINSSWLPENVTLQRALLELRRAQAMYRYLCDSRAFAASFAGNTPQFILSYDYGTGSVELARLSDDRIVWAKGFVPAPSDPLRQPT